MTFTKGHPNYAAAKAAVNQAAENDAVASSTANDPSDSDRVTVLYGYGQFKPQQHHMIDAVEFIGGVARNVPLGVARNWQEGRRADGKPSYNRINVLILPNDATEADFVHVSGLRAMSPEKMAALLKATDIDLICSTLSKPQVEQLISDLQRQVANR